MRWDRYLSASLLVFAAGFGLQCSSSEDGDDGSSGKGGSGGTAGSGGKDASPDTTAGTGGGGTGGVGGTGGTTCTEDKDCPNSALPRCHPITHACVACLNAQDNCPSDQYCDQTSYTCKPGCKDNTSCEASVCGADHTCGSCTPGTEDKCTTGSYCEANNTCVAGCKASGEGCGSGTCESDHDCDHCIADAECSNGKLCSSGQCRAACQGPADCPSGWDCCAGRCADLSRDFGHCKSCTTACSGEQFCGRTACGSSQVSSVCDVAKITLLLDGATDDDAATMRVKDALIAKCPLTPVTEVLPQGSAGVVHPTSGKPVAGSGNLLVVLGGSYFQHAVKYLEDNGVSRIFNVVDCDSIGFYARSEDGGAPRTVVEKARNCNTTPDETNHGYFLIESVVDRASNTWVLEVYGLSAQGTIAGAWYFENRVLANLPSYTGRYYVYEWSDNTADGGGPDAGAVAGPSADDTWTLIEQGP